MPTKVEKVINLDDDKKEKSVTHTWIKKYALVKDINYDRITPTHEIMNDLTYVDFMNIISNDEIKFTMDFLSQQKKKERSGL